MGLSHKRKSFLLGPIQPSPPTSKELHVWSVSFNARLEVIFGFVSELYLLGWKLPCLLPSLLSLQLSAAVQLFKSLRSLNRSLRWRQEYIARMILAVSINGLKVILSYSLTWPNQLLSYTTTWCAKCSNIIVGFLSVTNFCNLNAQK